MRIAIVTPAVNRRGGTEKCMSWLVEDLSRQAEVTLLTSEVADTDTSRCDVRRIRALPGPRLVRYLGFLAASSLMLGARRGPRRRFDVVLSTAGDCLSADIVYAHFCCAAWSDRLRRDSVELPGATRRQRLRRLHYRAFMRVAAGFERRIYAGRRLRAVAAVSAGTAAEISSTHGVAPELLTVVPNAVDDSVRVDAATRDQLRRATRDELRCDASTVLLLFVAAGDWKRKRLAMLLEALAILDNPQCRLAVVGDDDIAHYQARAAELGVAGRVVFSGFQSSPQRWYAAADVFVYPSAYEAFSLVTLEAAGAGLPLVVTATNGTAELVRDGENGVIVEPSAAAIAAALRPLVADPRLRQRMGRAAWESSQCFTREAVAGALLDLCASSVSTVPSTAEVAR